MDWRADLHTCGQPLSESLMVRGQANAEYRAGYMVCNACLELANSQREQEKKDEPIEKSGGIITRDARLWQVFRKNDN